MRFRVAKRQPRSVRSALPASFCGGNGTGHDLSLKDLSLIEYAPILSKTGISSFKIEGRMKRPEYVAAAVTALKNSLSGEYSSENSEDLCSLFSRSGFTKGYYENALGRNMFGFREKENVTSATASLLKNMSVFTKKSVRFTGCILFSL